MKIESRLLCRKTLFKFIHPNILAMQTSVWSKQASLLKLGCDVSREKNNSMLWLVFSVSNPCLIWFLSSVVCTKVGLIEFLQLSLIQISNYDDQGLLEDWYKDSTDRILYQMLQRSQRIAPVTSKQLAELLWKMMLSRCLAAMAALVFFVGSFSLTQAYDWVDICLCFMRVL